MKLKEKISWLMGRLQRQLFPFLEECCLSLLTELEKHLVNRGCFSSQAPTFIIAGV